MDKFREQNKNIDDKSIFNYSDIDEIIVEKRITFNDIRARIISIPREIIKKIPPNADKYPVTFNKEFEKKLTINRRRNYFGGVTEILKKYGMIDEDGVYNPKKSTWYWNNGKLDVVINREE